MRLSERIADKPLVDENEIETGSCEITEEELDELAQLEAEMRELARMHAAEYGNLKIASANVKVMRMVHENEKLEAENKRLLSYEAEVKEIAEAMFRYTMRRLVAEADTGDKGELSVASNDEA